MLLIHISDIHFREPDCLNPDTDADRPFRTKLIHDAHDQVSRLGVPADAILIGGDVAYKGHPREYEAAFEWIKELAAATRCPIERVFTIPGNHDVDRSHLGSDTKAIDAQSRLFGMPENGRERELRKLLVDPEAGPALLSAHAAYNDFAKRFNCQVYAPDRLYWKQDIKLDEACTLRVNGLTSTLLSGREGKAEARGSLYLSPLQTAFNSTGDIVHLAMCHHPPDWLSDGDDANDAISERTAIQLFGHKHRQRISREHSFIRFSAGAVNPDRQEAGWNPGYNLIEVSLEGHGRARKLRFRAHLRHWQSNPELYRAILDKNQSDVFEHEIALPTEERLTVRVSTGPTVEADKPTPSGDVAVSGVASSDSEAAMGDEGTRNLVYRFWNLTVSQRRAIALKLGLMEQSEVSLPEPERYGRVLRRAGERGLLERLAKEIASREV